LVALLVRLLYLWHFFSLQLGPGATRYFPLYEVVCVARSIASGHGFSSPLPAPSGPTAMVTPVFPFLLAGVFKMFGTLSLASSMVVRTLDVIFSALTCLPIAAIGRRLYGSPVGAVAAWIWALLPSSVFYSVVWIWDTALSVLLLTAALAATYWVAEREDKKSWGGLGFVFAIGTLVNSAILPVVPGCLAFAAYRARKRGVSWLRTAGISGITFCATLAPWVIRNEVVFRGQVLLRSNFGLELWLGNNPQVPISCACWLHPSDQPEERAKFLALGEVAYMREKQQLAMDFIKSHPSATLRFVYHRFMETWTGFTDSFADIWAGGDISLRASLLLNYGFTLLSLAGLLLARRASPLMSWPLLNLILVFPVVYYLCHMDPRYRQPLEPVMAVLTAFALARILRAVQPLFSLRQHKPEDLPAV
jgi:4-amino-4-deoxy-L-arabinose transferase-like glycosyltransferase